MDIQPLEFASHPSMIKKGKNESTPKRKAAHGEKVKPSPKGRDHLKRDLAGIGMAEEALKGLPEVKVEKVEEATQRAQEGFYDRPDVREKLVEKLLIVLKG